jgi:Cysteine rich repeat
MFKGTPMNHFRRTVSVAALALAVSSLSVPTSAEAAAPGDQSCRTEIRQLCGDVERGQLRGCIREHAQDFSAQCRERMEQRHHRRQQALEACRGDVERLCKDVEPGSWRIAQCLRSHSDELSKECSEKLSQPHGRGFHRQRPAPGREPSGEG